jgi:hypothetical protein
LALSPDEAEAALIAEGFAVQRDYHEAPFGSWVIEIEYAPRLRLNFDGRDRWLSLEWETERLFGGGRVWDTLWIGKTEIDLTVRMAVAMVRSVAEFADAVRGRRA